ncbi:hypothetical protein CRE_04879 [Caenorhabditis remanei]|uniref:Uncharacterized protein n=1 Tax=Caenorhabditis remanei TaxID=31234 RepID=E3LYM7_CAERE|nr:hypothetical protein CRE_04879 [Caenorhabditis remanei]
MRSDAKLINKIKTWTLDISAFFAISINILLIVLIITKSPKSIGAYKHLMIYIAFFELTYAISYVAEKPDIFTKGSAFLIITNTKESVFPVTLSIWLDVVFIGFYGLSIALLVIHFIYRYLAISNSELLDSFRNWKLVLWLLFPIINAGIWIYAAAVIFASTEDSDRFLKFNKSQIIPYQDILSENFICPRKIMKQGSKIYIMEDRFII